MELSLFALLILCFNYKYVLTQELYVTEGDEDEDMPEESEVPVLMLAVSGSQMTLPCDILSPMEDDEVYLVLWYKDEIATPIYSIDARRGHIEQARHASSDDLAGRSYFNTIANPAVLQVEHIGLEDEGIYRCRVDFRRARTRHSAILLRIVVPPSIPIIKDYNGEVLTGVIGPYNEGETPTLICQTEGGKPEPALVWWRGKKMLDDTYEEITNGVVRNEITLPKLRRSDLMATVTCRAENNKISAHVETSVTLDINFKPLSVVVKEKPRRLSAKKTVQFQCEARGSRPPATISWRKGSTKLKSSGDKVSGLGNVTTSILTFVPSSEDSGKFISCQADNPVIPGSTIEDSWKLEVHYVPQLSLRLGSKLRYSNILEGNDVYFECNIRATPWVSETGWKFDGKELQTNLTAGVIVSNQSLVLQKVQRVNRGKYTCTGTNTEGLGESNHFFLRVQYSPVCKANQETTHGAMLHYPVQIPCEVEADPDDVTFRWEFNSSTSGNIELIPTYTSGTKSLVNYIPRSEMDFGTLFCWGRNSVGTQKVPCTFLVLPAEPPASVQNCSVVDETERTFRILCSAGRDGGLNQYFFSEIREPYGNSLLHNVSSKTPEFSVRSLSPGTEYSIYIYATNAKGKSRPIILRATTLAPPESQTRKENDWQGTLSPLILILSGVAGGLLLVLIIVLIVVKLRLGTRKRGKESFGNLGTEKSIQGSEKSGDTCSEGCACTGRDEEKFRENIPDVVVFSEKLKPEDEDMVVTFSPDNVYWNRMDAPPIGGISSDYLTQQVKIKLQSPQDSSWHNQQEHWAVTNPMSFQSLQEMEDSRGLDQRYALQQLPTVEEKPASSPTVLTVMAPQHHQPTVVTARQTDV